MGAGRRVMGRLLFEFLYYSTGFLKFYDIYIMTIPPIHNGEQKLPICFLAGKLTPLINAGRRTDLLECALWRF